MLLNNSIKIILNIFYKPTVFVEQLIENDKQLLYFPINGGSSLRGKYNAKWLQFDDTKDNISLVNHALNEFTSIYWFWKNYKQKIDYVGFNHYRRLFAPIDFEDFRDYDAIVAKPYKFTTSLKRQYSNCHSSIDIQKLVGVLITFFNDGNKFLEYINSFELYAPCNMFLIKYELFDQYCNFIFPILFKLQDIIKLSADKYQHRAIAFLSERLTSFWFKQLSKKIKIKEIPIIFMP